MVDGGNPNEMSLPWKVDLNEDDSVVFLHAFYLMEFFTKEFWEIWLQKVCG